jgi:putative ABC transport system substrate-binding protein
MIRRRDFITLLGGAAAWPLAARAQAVMPVVGYLAAGTPETWANVVAAFRKGLGEIGFAEGQNVAIEFRWARNELDRLPELAADLVRRRPVVIATPSSAAATLAAKAATTTIPIVFSTGADPVQTALVASLNRPGGNVTGVNNMSGELGAKQLGLLHELLPAATRFAVLINPNFPPWLGKPRQRRCATVRQGVGVASVQEPLIPQVFRRRLYRRCLSATTRGCAARSSTPRPSARRGGQPGCPAAK